MVTDESRSATAASSPESRSYELMEEDKSQKGGDTSDSPDESHDFPEGGARAWAVAAGTGGILFCTLGYTNSFGVFQAYYMSNQLQNESTDRIAWIGSLQGFLIFAAGSIGGPLFDRYGAKVIRPAAVLYIFAIMMTSLCKEYWQFMLAQGVLTGIADGLLMFPAMSALPQYFHKKRGAAMGLGIAGSSLGGVVFPIILGKMLNQSSLSFGWSVRICGFVMLPILALSSIAIKARLPPRTTDFFLPSAFKMPLYDFLIAASFCLFIGMFTPLFFLPTYAIEQGMSPTLASYLVSILNAASIPGRILPGILADKLGRLNMLLAAGVSTAIIVFCWAKLEGVGGIVVYAIAFGFCSGAIVSGATVAITLCPKNPKDVGTYMGQGIAIAALATLVGPPVTGALVDKYGGFTEAVMFSGAFCMFGGVLMVFTKRFTEKGIWGRV